ncbi:MAG: hypothetical protein ACXWC9_04785 [Pseudobdellovibrionaceae bacterium]
MIRQLGGLFLGLSLISSSLAHAYLGSVSAATGEAGRAAVEASEAPFGNPATLGLMKGYYLTAGFGATKQNKVGTNQDLAISVTDSMKETVVPTSFSFVQNTTRPEGVTDDLLARAFKLSFGNMLNKQVAFGLGIIHQDDRFPEDRYAQTNVQTGFLWTPNQNIGAAVTFDNMIPIREEAAPEAYRLKQTIGIGSSFNYKKMLRLKVDVISAENNTFGKPTLAAGLESYMNRWMVLRWGAQRNNHIDANLYTAGLGFIGPRFGLHYAYQSSPQNESLTRHSVDLALPIW